MSSGGSSALLAFPLPQTFIPSKAPLPKPRSESTTSFTTPLTLDSCPSSLCSQCGSVSQGSTLSAAGPHTGPSRQTTVILRDVIFIRVCRPALGERECRESKAAVGLLTSHLQPARLSAATGGPAWLLLETSPAPPFREPTPSPMRLGFMSSPPPRFLGFFSSSVTSVSAPLVKVYFRG